MPENMPERNLGQPSNGHPPAYLSSISYEVGRPTPLGELDDAELSAALAVLTDEGLSHCRVVDGPISAVAAASARETLCAGDGLTSPDVVIYCSDTPESGPPALAAAQLAVGAGVPSVPVLRVGGGECGNLGLGVRVARGVLLTEGLSSVLLVTADRATGDSRHLPDSLTVLSDGAASCLISAAPVARGFAISGVVTSVQASAAQAGAGMAMARGVAAGIGRAARRLLDELSLTPADCRYLLVGNYGTAVRSLFAGAAGFPRDAVRTPLIAEMGHCFSADLLMSLHALVARGELDPGDRAMLLASGSHGWSVLVADYMA